MLYFGESNIFVKINLFLKKLIKNFNGYNNLLSSTIDSVISLFPGLKSAQK